MVRWTLTEKQQEVVETLRSSGRAMTRPEIAAAMGCSAPSLEESLPMLVRMRLVNATRSGRGGFKHYRLRTGRGGMPRRADVEALLPVVADKFAARNGTPTTSVDLSSELGLPFDRSKLVNRVLWILERRGVIERCGKRQRTGRFGVPPILWRAKR